jgi:hypothetical protein
VQPLFRAFNFVKVTLLLFIFILFSKLNVNGSKTGEFLNCVEVSSSDIKLLEDLLNNSFSIGDNFESKTTENVKVKNLFFVKSSSAKVNCAYLAINLELRIEDKVEKISRGNNSSKR